MRSVHPTTYSDNLLGPIAHWVEEFAMPGPLLDPFGGLGHGLACIAELAGGLEPVAVEIEPAYFDLGETHACVQLGDSTNLQFPDETFGAACTSPAYPNGCTDNFRARDASARNTYIHRIREWVGPDYDLHPNNLGGSNARRSPAALAHFYALQLAVFREVFRVLKLDTPFVVNTKDTPHEAYTEATRRQLEEIGFVIVEEQAVPAAGLNHGANQANGKAEVEDLTVAIKSPNR